MQETARPGVGIAIGIPVKNEFACIGRCLNAIAAQTDSPVPDVVLLVNNTTDGTADLVRSLAPSLRLRLHLHEVTLPPERACAGWARKLAMDAACGLAGPNGVLLTTDADGYVAPDWIAANLRSLASGVGAVAGIAEIDPDDAALIPAVLHEDDARECGYAALLDELDALLDPDPYDPLPRHDQHSGASIAVTAAMYARAGGIPPVKIGEDRAFFDALRRADARIRHSPDVIVTVSGRIEGRASGGMADTIRRRLVQPDQMADDRLEAADRAAFRSELRRRCREVFSSPLPAREAIGVGFARGFPDPPLAALLQGGEERNAALARALRLSPDTLAYCMRQAAFGAAWEAVQAASPALRRERLQVADLPRESTRAGLLIAQARLNAGMLAARSGDSSPAVADW